MIKVFNIFFLVFLFSCLFSCSKKKFLNEDELYEYLIQEKNGYIYRKEINNYKVSLMYKPVDLMVSQTLLDNVPVNQIEVLRGRYEKKIYFVLDISQNGRGVLSQSARNSNEYAEWVNKFTFGLSNEVRLVSDKGVDFPLIDYIYPRMYGTSRSNTLMFVFSNEKSLNGKYLLFTLDEIGLGIGEIKFKIPIKRILNQPQIDFNHGEN